MEHFPTIEPGEALMAIEENYHHFRMICEEAWRMKEEWGVDPSWWLTFQPYIFDLAAQVPARQWRSFCTSMYCRDKAFSVDMNTPLVFRGWQTIDESEHPCATPELVSKMQK